MFSLKFKVRVCRASPAIVRNTRFRLPLLWGTVNLLRFQWGYYLFLWGRGLSVWRDFDAKLMIIYQNQKFFCFFLVFGALFGIILLYNVLRGILKILIFESSSKIIVSFRLLFVLNKMLPLNNL